MLVSNLRGLNGIKTKVSAIFGNEDVNGEGILLGMWNRINELRNE